MEIQEKQTEQQRWISFNKLWQGRLLSPWNVWGQAPIDRGSVHIADLSGNEEWGLSLCLEDRQAVTHEGLLYVLIEVGVLQLLLSVKKFALVLLAILCWSHAKLKHLCIDLSAYIYYMTLLRITALLRYHFITWYKATTKKLKIVIRKKKRKEN